METQAEEALIPLYAESYAKNDVNRTKVIRLSSVNPPQPIQRLIPKKLVPDAKYSSNSKDDTTHNNHNADIFYTVKVDHTAVPTGSSKYKRFHIDDAYFEANSKRTRLIIHTERDRPDTTLYTSPKSRPSGVKVLDLYGMEWLHVQSLIPVLRVYFYGPHQFQKLHTDKKNNNLVCQWMNVDALRDNEYDSANKALNGFVEHFGLKKKAMVQVWNGAFSIDREGKTDIKVFHVRNKSFKRYVNDA
tara:strand:- start:527 stop:1261 length:735 start_codon:yes stop_codon:yes gene_type:complete